MVEDRFGLLSSLSLMSSRLLRLATIAMAWTVATGTPAAEGSRKLEGSRSEPGGARAPADYVLQPEDVLRVQIFQEEDINRQGEVRISQEHTIFLPLIKTISLKGKTVRQAEEMIRGLFAKDFLVNPQVSVAVLKYAERSVSVNGAVNTAGRILFPQERGLTIVEAISSAGGQSRVADLKKVRLTRRNAAGEMTTMVIDVESINKGGARDPVPLENGDTIFVPEKIF
jgi:polysaccharide export outer membrane protein